METDTGTKATVQKCLWYLSDFYWDFSTWRERIPHAFLAEQSSPPRYRSGSVGALESIRANLAAACVYLRTAGYGRHADDLERLFADCLADIKQLKEWFDDPKRIREQGEDYYPLWSRELTQENAWYYSDVDQRHDDELEDVLGFVLDALCDQHGITITYDDADSPAFPWRLRLDAAKDDEPGVAAIGETPKGVAGRDELFHRWYNEEEADTYHSPTRIVKKWNEMSREVQATYGEPCIVTLNTVKQVVIGRGKRKMRVTG